MLCMEVIQVSTRGRIETVQGSASAVKREYLMYLDMRACVPDFKAATILTFSTRGTSSCT